MGYCQAKFRIAAITIQGTLALALIAPSALSDQPTTPAEVAPQTTARLPPPPRPLLIQYGAPLAPPPLAPPPAAQRPAATSVTSGTWIPLDNQPSFSPGSIFLMTDGTVLAQDDNLINQAWWKFSPGITGSYIGGAWTGRLTARLP